MSKKEIRKAKLRKQLLKIKKNRVARQKLLGWPEKPAKELSSPTEKPAKELSSRTSKITILVSTYKSKKYIGLPVDPLHYNNEVIVLDNETWQNNYDKFNLYDYKTLDEIPEGEKYFIHLTMYWDLLEYYLHNGGSFNTKNKPYPMPDRVWRDSGNGLVHWIINYNTECNQLNGVDCFDITDINTALNTTSKNVTLITGAATVDTGKSLIENFEYNVVTGTELWNFCQFDTEFDKENQSQKIRSICNKDVMLYKSLNYNRLPRQHRTIIVAHQMHHNYTEALYSLMAGKNKGSPKRWMNWAEYFPEYNKEFEKLEELNDIYCDLAEEGYTDTQGESETGDAIYWNKISDADFMEALYSKYPDNVEWQPATHYNINDIATFDGSVFVCTANHTSTSTSERPIDLQKNLADKAGWNHALNSSFQLVTETHPFYMKYPFITEKSIKPLGMLMPFIQSAPQYNIKYLREYGVRMFDKWIDHSYDNEPDDILRLRMVLKEFDRLYAIPKEQWAQMLVEMLPDLLHNAFLLTQHPMHSVESQLIPIFLEFLNDD